MAGTAPVDSALDQRLWIPVKRGENFTGESAKIVTTIRKLERHQTVDHPLCHNNTGSRDCGNGLVRTGSSSTGVLTKKKVETLSSKSRNGTLTKVDIGHDPLSLAHAASLNGSESTLTSKQKNISAGSKRNRKCDWRTQQDRILKQTLLYYPDALKLESKFKYNNGTNSERLKSKSRSITMSKANLRLAHLEVCSETPNSAKVHVNSVRGLLERIEKLDQDLLSAWSRNEKVLSLKLVIQCSKILVETQGMVNFYPYIWSKVVDVLDSFGNLVYERIEEKSEDGLTTKNTVDMAKERCRNWFYKITCIRELVPRIYIETALLPCYSFLFCPETHKIEITKILERLSSLIRGVADPTSAVFARAYLAKKADSCEQLLGVSLDKGYLRNSINDYIYSVEDTLKRRKNKNFFQTLKLHESAVEIVFQFYGTVASEVDYKELIGNRLLCEKSNAGLAYGSGLHFPPFVLLGALKYFDSCFFSMSALDVIDMINRIDSKLCHDRIKGQLLSELLRQVCIRPLPNELKGAFLHRVKETVERIQSVEAYAGCCHSLVEVTIQLYSEAEVIRILKDLGSRLNGAGGDTIDNVTPQLEKICSSICSSVWFESSSSRSPSSNQLGSLFVSEEFMKILYMFKSEKKTVLCKELLRSFFLLSYNNRTGLRKDRAIGLGGIKIADPIEVHAIFALCRDLHDSIDALSSKEERKQVSELLCCFVNAIDFGEDVQEQLRIYVDCRASFPGFDSVKELLIHKVLLLTHKVFAHVIRGERTSNMLDRRGLFLRRSYHTNQSGEFVKSCLAYCYITIPSITNILRRISLFRLGGSVALSNQLLPQTDAFFKASILSVTEVPSSPIFQKYRDKRWRLEEILTSEIRALSSALLPVPGNPDGGPFYLIKGLINAVNGFPWIVNRCDNFFIQTSRIRILTMFIPLLSSMGQNRLPELYRLANVYSNNALYGGHRAYGQELVHLISGIITEVSDELENMTVHGEKKYESILERLKWKKMHDEVKQEFLYLLNTNCRLEK